MAHHYDFFSGSREIGTPGFNSQNNINAQCLCLLRSGDELLAARWYGHGQIAKRPMLPVLPCSLLNAGQTGLQACPRQTPGKMAHICEDVSGP